MNSHRAGFVAIAALVMACAGSTPVKSNPPGSIDPAPSATPVSTPTPAASPTPTANPDALLGWIAYQGPDGLMILRPDGSDPRPALPNGPSAALHPDWSSDGMKLAFSVDQDAAETRDLWIADWDGANSERLIDCEAPCADADAAAWSPDGTEIAFVTLDRVDGRWPGSKLQIIDVGTRSIRTIVETTAPDYVGGPRWSSDGRSIVVEVVRYDADTDDAVPVGSAIGIVEVPTGSTLATVRIISAFETWASYPDWHPSRDLILFAAGAMDPLDLAGDPSNLFTIGPDGSRLTQITFQGPTDALIWMPAWRHDGEGILATLIHRGANAGNLTLISMRGDGTVMFEIGSGGPTPGAHSRQRPVPTAP